MRLVVSALLAGLLGAFPSGYVFTKLIGAGDIRRLGSGNVGGVNTFKSAGMLPGLLTLLCDFGKGALAVYLAGVLAGPGAGPLLALFCVILGHNYNPFLGFQGGKGLAAGLGGAVVLSPPVAAIMLLIVALAALLLRDANTGAGIGMAALPVVFWFLYRDWLWILGGVAVAGLIILKHRHDFQAYRAGRRQLF